jgi:hypothetical protein
VSRLTGKADTRALNPREDVVRRFFKLMESKVMEDLLNLFEYDAVVHEPFSKEKGLHGRSEIEPFLKVAMMASGNLRRKIEIEKFNGNDNMVSALVTFERGDKLKGRFTFELDSASKKIRSLDIQFAQVR